jgi:hypothetical protein
MVPAEPPRTPRQRGRCLSVPRRKLSSVHPISPVVRGKSAAARFREERVEKAGIHSPHINVVSDEALLPRMTLTTRALTTGRSEATSLVGLAGLV